MRKTYWSSESVQAGKGDAFARDLRRVIRAVVEEKE